MGRANAGRPFGQPLHDAELIGDVVQIAGVAVDVGERHLAHDCQHRRVVPVGLRKRGCGVEETRTRYHAVGGGFARGHGGAERQIGRALLMAGVDRTDAVRLVVEGIEEGIVLDARQAKQRVDTVCDQPLDDDFGRSFPAGHRARFSHLVLPARWLRRPADGTVQSAPARVKPRFMVTDMPPATRPLLLRPSATLPLRLAFFGKGLGSLDRILAAGHRHVGWIVEIAHGDLECRHVERAQDRLLRGADAHR